MELTENIKDAHLHLWLDWSSSSPAEPASELTHARVDCNRLYPSQDRLMAHRKRDHDTNDTSNIISWAS
jgi:hypothetical protein